ncbi:MAG TPA: BTAD domain-containing putative transcriptional regulator [Kineosporiaceae bacterium]|nr:BTAD domain-containing putative transcriptional regulator [Kineosporiaceae bacterium]
MASLADAASLIELGRQALHEAGDLRASRHWFELACRSAERSGDRQALAEAGTGLGGIWLHEQRNAAVRARFHAWQSRALATATIGSDQHLLLRARLAAETDYLHGRYDEVLPVLKEARHRGNPQVLASVLSLAHHCVLGPRDTRLRAELAQELLVVAAHTERRIDRLVGLMWRSVDLFLEADPKARRSLAEFLAELAEGNHLALAFVAKAMQVMLATRAGDFDRAEALAAECLAAGEACGDADAASWYSAQLLAIRWFQGRVTDLLPMLSGQVDSPDLSAIDEAHIAALAVAAAVGGGHREAAGALARLGRGDLTNIPMSSAWMVTLYGATEAAAKLADREIASTAYALLEPFANLPMMGSLAITCFGSVEHALGVASLTTGHVDRAIGHLRRAVRANLALEHWPAACLSRYRLAQAFIHRAGPTDAADAAREQATAAHEARRLGMLLPSNQRIPVAKVSSAWSRSVAGSSAALSTVLAAASPTVVAASSATARTMVTATPPTSIPALAAPALTAASAGVTGTVTAPSRAGGSADPTVAASKVAPDSARSESEVQIRLLGPLEVGVAGQTRPVLGHRRRTVLAVLALQAGEIVSVDRLIDVVWGDRPPRTALNTVQSHVSYLRRVIGNKAAIVGRPPGYLLDLGSDATDVATAERLIQAGARAGEPIEQVRHLQAALALWRGRPLADVTASSWLELQAERLNQLLLQAHQLLTEVRLARGEYSLLTMELRPLIREYPLAERLHGYLMLALYREGRQSEALEVYRRLRTVLSDELGVEPTEPLRALQVAILRQDPVRAVDLKQ